MTKSERVAVLLLLLIVLYVVVRDTQVWIDWMGW